jgi:hypothetical protein
MSRRCQIRISTVTIVIWPSRESLRKLNIELMDLKEAPTEELAYRISHIFSKKRIKMIN